jgi:hypothetical protein
MPKTPEIDLDKEDSRKAAQTRYSHTEKFKLAQQKYYLSAKGKKAHEAQNTQVSLFRKYDNFLKENPGSRVTIQEFEVSLKKPKTKKRTKK